MSLCPSCGKKAVHYGVVVPWETAEKPDVLHKCACGLLFIEPARDVPAMFAKVEWWLEGFDPESIAEVGDVGQPYLSNANLDAAYGKPEVTARGD